MRDIFEEIVRIKNEGIPSALATVTSVKGSSPGKEHFKMLVCQDGQIIGTVGGGAVESQVIEKAKEIIISQKPEEFEFNLVDNGPNASGMLCGGVVTIFIEPIVNDFVYIFGGGHIGLYLSKILDIVGFRYTIIDDRPEFSNKDRFPNADNTISIDYESINKNIILKNPAYIIITTRGHKFDQLVLEWAIDKNYKYLGMIGSRQKISIIYDSLKANGVSNSIIEKIHSPIGIDINAQTAQEIAIAIVAELIKVKRSA